jgi:ABC-type antimicrobial peptide transport system permease subunit
MGFGDIFGMCVRNLVKRKLRTFLTMLGVIIGTAALVLIVSLGLASDARFERIRSEFMGDLTSIEIWQSGGVIWDAEGNMITLDHIPDLDDAMIDRFQEIPGVMVATPLMNQSLFLRSGNYVMRWARIVGIRAEALALMGHNLADGRLIEPGEEHAAVFGGMAELNFQPMVSDRWIDRMWDAFMGEEVETFVDVFNETIMYSYDSRFVQGGMREQADISEGLRPVSTFQLNVVGVFESTGDMWGFDTNIFMDISTMRALSMRQMRAEVENRREHGFFMGFIPEPRETYDQAWVRVYDPMDTGRVAAEIRELGFSVWYQGSHIARDQEQQQTMQNMLIAIAAVSIFVAAISIANTMIMAVYERTREIGVMKVIGGSVSDIRKMFLLEAAMIGFLGGVFGVLLSLGGQYVLNEVDAEFLRNMGFMGTSPEGDVTSLITTWLMGLALLFASIIGLISGYFPARRATKLSALTAIRTD